MPDGATPQQHKCNNRRNHKPELLRSRIESRTRVSLFRVGIIVVEPRQVDIFQQAPAERKLQERQVAEHILVGHLDAERALGPDLLDGLHNVDEAGVFQPLDANVQGDEGAWNGEGVFRV